MSKERLEELKLVLKSWEAWNESQRIVLKDLTYYLEQVEVLEEGNKNLKALRSINRKERMRIHDQNKRYREYLARLKRATNRYPAEDMAYVVNKITSEALEGDSDE